MRDSKISKTVNQLWQDACEALGTLYSERVKETGGSVEAGLSTMASTVTA